MSRLLLLVPLAALIALGALSVSECGAAQEPPKKQDDAKKADPPKKKRRFEFKKADGPLPGREPPATAPETLKVAKGFKAELLYSVPKDKEGSWVNLCVDPKGRLIVSDQYGGLYRVTPPPLGGPASATRVEPINVPLGEAQGLLWAFDSLYVVTNGRQYEIGLYRVRDTDGDDNLDKVELLRRFNGGGGEHGPHAVLLSPSGKSLVVVCGNQTRLLDPLDSSRVPRVWGEDHVLPRMPDGNGFMRGVLAPGGCIYEVDPEGKHWQLVCNGFRNEYDAAFNRHGDLFTYDADMEWDFNTPWYRPTRVNLAASGAEFGWRNGAGKWPAYYPDSLPSVVDVGPGSPTGVCFGYGAKFPAKYQEAFFICDWSYGKLYAVHLIPQQSAYVGELEEFVTGTPLPLTDVVINPKDGAMYFAIGGRRTKSGLYRVTYAGTEPTAPSTSDDRGARERAIRFTLESYHGRKDPKAVEVAWPYLSHPDRYIRFAARVALEHQDPAAWQDRALVEKNPQAALTALLGLVRATSSDPQHKKNPVNPEWKSRVLQALDRIGWKELTDDQRLELVRIYQVAFVRMGPPNEGQRKRVLAQLDPHYPSGHRYLNAELCQTLVFLEAPQVAARTLKLLATAPTQEEQMEYAKSLRALKNGWTPEQRKEYFSWFVKAGGFKGGNSFGGFMRNIKGDAVATLTADERTALKPILDAQPASGPVFTAKQRPFVKKWAVDELTSLVEKKLAGRDFDRGRTLFGETTCFGCHRFANEGGAAGPDLTGAAGRFSVRDLLEQIVEPSKVISDQYAAVVIATSDGKVTTGRIVNLNDDSISVNTNMLEPNTQARVNRRLIEKMEPSKVSMMPEGLLDTLREDEVLDLVAYVLSRGDRGHTMFQKK